MTKIKTRSVFYTHTIAISAFFIMGQFVITQPFISGFYSLLGYFLSAAAGVLVCFLALPLTAKIINFKNAVIKGIILFAAAVFAAFTLAETFKVFCRFASSVLLDSSSLFLAVVLFGAACFYFSFRRQEDILKFSLLSFIYTVVIILIFTLLLLPNFKTQNITLPQKFDISELVYDAKNQFLSIFAPAVLLGFYQYAVFGKVQKGVNFVGFVIGALLLAVCVFSSVLLFGTEFSAVLDFPYIAVVSTVSVGKLFSRLDAVLYLFFFCSCLLKIQVCIFVIKFCLKKTGKMQKN